MKLVPHFEKMLYDNALLLRAYIEGYAATGDHDMLFVAEKTAQYIMRDMQAHRTRYDSAEDADSEGEEGFLMSGAMMNSKAASTLTNFLGLSCAMALSLLGILKAKTY